MDYRAQCKELLLSYLFKITKVNHTYKSGFFRKLLRINFITCFLLPITEKDGEKFEMHLTIHTDPFFWRGTGLPIKICSHSFNLTCSHDRDPSNLKTSFICLYTELSFIVYNSFLRQLTWKWGVVKVRSLKQKCLEEVSFTSLTGSNLNFILILD